MSANIVFSSSYWRIFKAKEFCVLCFYRYQAGRSHELEFQETFPDLNETFKHIDSTGCKYPVILTSDGSPFNGL